MKCFFIVILAWVSLFGIGIHGQEIKKYEESDLFRASLLDGMWVHRNEVEGFIIIYKISSMPYSSYEISKNPDFKARETLAITVNHSSINKRNDGSCVIPEEIHRNYIGYREGSSAYANRIGFRDFSVIDYFDELQIEIVNDKLLRVVQEGTYFSPYISVKGSFDLVRWNG